MYNDNNYDFLKQDYNAWKNRIQDYTESKKKVAWSHLNPAKESVYPVKISHRMVKEKENIFNPITGLYNDVAQNEYLNNIEHQNLINTVASNYDNQLRNEQTYNIINLNDHFSKFENCTINDGPKIHNKLNKEISKAPYNIISNLSLSEHHYKPPEKRPKIEITPQKIKQIPSMNSRDYNIINNQYVRDNELKSEVDKRVEELQAAKNFLDKQEYDIIKGRYNDQDKENEFQKKIQENEQNWYKNHKDHNNILINPINNHVYDQKKQDEIDLREYNKKKRFRLRENINDYYRNLGYSQELKEEQAKDNRVSYYNYKISDNRGYDILNFNNVYSKYKDGTKNQKRKQLKNDWELILEGAGQNETFKSKNIYKAPYDSSDIDQDRHKYFIERNKMLNNLPVLTEDNRFGVQEKRIKKIKDEGKIVNTGRNLVFDKAKWFKNKRRDFSLDELSFNHIFSNDNIGIKGEINKDKGRLHNKNRVMLSTEF